MLPSSADSQLDAQEGRTTFQNVLVGVDGRPGGRDAVALAAELLAPHGHMTLAHIREGELNPLHAITPNLVRDEHASSQQLLELDRVAVGIEAELMSIVALSPGRALHEQAERQGADLLVVGSCSRGPFGRVMLGDDTRSALDGAACAVAIAARGFAESSGAIARIGVAYNGSRESEAALEAARSLASAAAPIRALEVVSLPIYGVGAFAMPIVESIDEVLERANRRLSELHDVQARAVYGLVPGEELAEFGDELDLLVVGSRSYGPVRRLMIGSTSNYLERHARCSLLVLPRPSTGDADAQAAG
jgi:nucleotide-binding universal stress UspA family protein